MCLYPPTAMKCGHEPNRDNEYDMHAWKPRVAQPCAHRGVPCNQFKINNDFFRIALGDEGVDPLNAPCGQCRPWQAQKDAKFDAVKSAGAKGGKLDELKKKYEDKYKETTKRCTSPEEDIIEAENRLLQALDEELVSFGSEGSG